VRVGFEFKQFLTRETHLKGERRQTLACQMKYKLLQADGKTQYIVGITDSGYLKGISRPQLDESVHVLHAIARDVGAHVCGVEEYAVKGAISDYSLSKHALGKRPYSCWNCGPRRSR